MLAPCSQEVLFTDGVRARHDPLYPFHERGLCLHSSLCLAQGVAILLAHNARAVYLSSLPAHCMFVEALTTFRVLACMQVVRTSLTVVKLQLVSFGVSGLEILFALAYRFYLP